MKKYRKKPVVVEAVQFDPETSPWPDCVVRAKFQHNLPRDRDFWPAGTPIIHTLEGPHRVSAGDWIIKGIKGEFYPCKPDIFEATYEEVGEFTAKEKTICSSEDAKDDPDDAPRV